MEESNREYFRLFGMGFLQVGFVAANAYSIAHYYPFAIILTSFAISYIWSHNVKKVAFGDEAHRLVYASGAAVGCIFGVEITRRIASVFGS